MMRGHSSIGTVLILLSACASTTDQTLGDSDRRAVIELSDRYAQAWLAGDSAAIMDVFAADAVLVPHLGNPHAVGKHRIREHFWPSGSPPARIIEFWRESAAVSGTSQLAVDRGRYRLVMEYEGDTLRNEGNYVAVARRDARAWKWILYTWNHR